MQHHPTELQDLKADRSSDDIRRTNRPEKVPLYLLWLPTEFHHSNEIRNTLFTRTIAIFVPIKCRGSDSKRGARAVWLLLFASFSCCCLCSLLPLLRFALYVRLAFSLKRQQPCARIYEQSFLLYFVLRSKRCNGN